MKLISNKKIFNFSFELNKFFKLKYKNKKIKIIKFYKYHKELLNSILKIIKKIILIKKKIIALLIKISDKIIIILNY